MRDRIDVLVVGGGPAGLATAAELGRRGIECRVLESGDRVGWCWRRLYDSLRLHTGKHLSALPGKRFAAEVPLFPSRGDFVRYLESYADVLAPEVETGCRVARLRPRVRGWRAEIERGGETMEVAARAVVVATGILSTPVWPYLPGRQSFVGELVHSVAYRRPEPFRSRRVLVVGCGNSAAEIATELAEEGVEVDLSVRGGAHVVPRSLLGIPIQYFAIATRQLPRCAQRLLNGAAQRLGSGRRASPLPRPVGELGESVPLIGGRLIAALSEGRIGLRGALCGVHHRGGCFEGGSRADYDVILTATGYRPSLQPLDAIVSVDDGGFARRRDRVASAEHRGLFFVGHSYDSRGGLYNIRIDSRLAARAIAAELAA